MNKAHVAYSQVLYTTVILHMMAILFLVLTLQYVILILA